MRKLITTLILATCVTGTCAAASLHVRHHAHANSVPANHNGGRPTTTRSTAVLHFEPAIAGKPQQRLGS